VTVGSLLPGQTRRVIVRLHCPAGAPGAALTLGVSADGVLPGGGMAIEAAPVDVALRFAYDTENKAQPRDDARALAVVNAWQAEIVRNAVIMNRDGDARAARHYIERELRYLERYARDVPGAEPMLRGLVLVQRSVHEDWDERTRKELWTRSIKTSRSEVDRRSGPRASLEEMFRRPPRGP
jgi:hypothetical protein